MKRLILAGITVLLVVFFVTCDLGFPGKDADDDTIVDYTDVEYSADGSAITVYLDGSKPVPVTKAQRAMTRNLSRMAYDYIEVLFVNTSSASPGPAVKTIARSSWELGQSAGISGVDRNGTIGVDYLYKDFDTTTPDDIGDNDGTNGKALALMFVGKKDGKTLLGIGRILQVDRLPIMDKDTKGNYIFSTTPGLATFGLPTLAAVQPPDGPTGYTALITDDTISVTFWIESVKTGLLIGGETLGTKDNFAWDSFTSCSLVAPVPPSPPAPAPSPDYYNNGARIRADARRSPLGNLDYPLYPLPTPKKVPDAGFLATGTPNGVGIAAINDTRGNPNASSKDANGKDAYLIYAADYEFGGGAKTFIKQIKPDGPPVADPRFPRYLHGGRYMAPQSNVDTDSLVWVDIDTYRSAAYANYPGPTDEPKYFNKVPLYFQPKGFGIFSFYIETPVYMFLRTGEDGETDKPTNGGPDAVIWKIRTGLGSELYSLDNGLASGGCVLMGVGVTALDWLEIEWNWIN